MTELFSSFKSSSRNGPPELLLIDDVIDSLRYSEVQGSGYLWRRSDQKIRIEIKMKRTMKMIVKQKNTVTFGAGHYEAGTTFDNSFFDNSFGFLRQFKNGSFLDPVFVHVTGRSQN